MSKAAPVTAITREGQKFFDEPVFIEHTVRTAIADAVTRISRRRLPRIETLDHYERVPLRWMKPDGKGGIVPRGSK